MAGAISRLIKELSPEGWVLAGALVLCALAVVLIGQLEPVGFLAAAGLALALALRVGRSMGAAQELQTTNPPTPGPTTPLPPTPPGLAEAYDNAAKKLADQLSQIDQLDTKLGVVIAALAVAVGAFIVATFSPSVRAVFAVLLAASMIQATRAFLVRRYADAPDPVAYARKANLAVQAMQQTFLPNLLRAYDSNAVKIAQKGQLLNQAVFAVTLAAVVAVIGKVFGGG